MSVAFGKQIGAGTDHTRQEKAKNPCGAAEVALADFRGATDAVARGLVPR
jgi:hypothetical protein